MMTAVQRGKRVFAEKEGSTRRWASRAAWIPLAAMLLVFAGWLALTVLGYRTLVVLTGSMEPALSPGDVAVVEVIRPGEARPLDVVTFRDPSRSNQLVTHRVVSMTQVGNKLGFLTKGDRNTGTEQWTVDPNGTIGRLSFPLPVLGRAIMWFGSPGVRAMLVATALIVMGGMAVRYIWRLGGSAPSTMPVAAVAIMGLLAGAVTVPATLAAFSSATGNSGNTFEAAASFCTAPGTQTVQASADAWLFEENNNPEGSDTSLYVRSKGTGQNRRTLVSFNLPAVPSRCSVTDSSLRLYAKSSQGTRTIEAWRVTGAWVESTVTWANQPGTSGPAVSSASGAGWRTWTVTGIVQTMYAGTNNGFLLKDLTESELDFSQVYSSREDASNKPELTVTFG